MCERCGHPCERRYCSQACRARANQSRYRASLKGKAVQARYQASRLGRAAQRRYQRSEKGKVAHERYLRKTYPDRKPRKPNILLERDWLLRKLQTDPAYRELIRQRISDEQRRRYRRERQLKVAA